MTDFKDRVEKRDEVISVLFIYHAVFKKKKQKYIADFEVELCNLFLI